MAAPPDETAADLVFQGRVVELAPLPASAGVARWRVTVAVERVTEGAFAGDRFAFAVHSPVKSGLALGGIYAIRARRTADGYSVDPLQWLPATRPDPA